jgi:hypothetical protein
MSGRINTFFRRPTAREFLIFICFCALTALMTWPWILHLRDAVVDKGDPYMIAWTLWWDFHQTFHNPLHLFDANVFYPYRYTLAFSENDYGIALPFFPLFALGLRPLTVHAIATFFGFAFSGYGSFRLTRTLTGDDRAAWLAGIIFAFIPYRFHLLSHLHYLFAGWLPLVCEALILFARKPSWKRSIWLGAAFLMNALTCVSWFIMALVPLGLTLLFLLFATRGLVRSRAFWIRGAVALAGALFLFSPFLFVYYRVSVLYGLRWQPWEFAHNSALPIHWLKADPRNKLWHNLGAWMTAPTPLFPGMLAPLLALLALRLPRNPSTAKVRRYSIGALYAIILLAAFVAGLGLGYGDLTIKVFGLRIIRLNYHSVTHALMVIVVAAIVRAAISLPAILRRSRKSWTSTNQVDLLRGQSAIAIGFIWMVWGFFSSLGPNFFLYRWLLRTVLLFQSIRFPSRTAMICYVGLAVLGGIGGARLADRLQSIVFFKKLPAFALVLIAGALLFELRAAPLFIEKGEVDPSALALRLKQTPMAGGIVELPSEADLARHFYMLRAADHQRPLVNATSTFISPITDQINQATRAKIDPVFMDFLEQIPTSYLVIHNDRMAPEGQAASERFVKRAVMSGRLRFVNRFDGSADLYAVVKNEPGAISEAPLPFQTSFRDWRAEIQRDPLNLLAQPEQSQTLYRTLLTSSGGMPRYSEFLPTSEEVAAYVDLNGADEAEQFEQNLTKFAARLVQAKSFSELDNRGYVERLIRNTNIGFESWEADNLVKSLNNGRSRAQVLMIIANDDRLVEKEKDRSLLLLHYFAYLRRNPDDPPDYNLNAFNYWLQEMAKHHEIGKIATAFQDSIEFHSIKDR